MENNDWQSTEHRAMQRHTAAAMRLLLDAGLRADRRGFSQAAVLLCILCERPELERLAEAYGLAERVLGATPQQLEHNLRVAIREAWERGDRALLRRLLPWCSDACPPETKGFLFGLAARLRASVPRTSCRAAAGTAKRRMTAARRRRMARRKKPQLLLETAYEQRRADGGRAPHRQKPTRRRRASLQQQRSRRRNLPCQKKPLPLPGSAHEQRRADGGRAAGSHRTDRNRRAGGEHRSTREWRAGGTCRARRSPCPYRERRMNRGAWADVAVRME